MKKVLAASVVGTLVYFVWQMATWMMIPIHGPTVAGLPNEDAVRDALMAQNLETGVYLVPWGEPEDMSDPESQFMKRHKEGPVVTIFLKKEGGDAMAPSTMLFGLLLDFVGIAIVATLLNCVSDAKCLASFAGRVGFVTTFGVIIGLMAHVAYYIWMSVAGFYTAMWVVDVVVGWFLVGLVLAAMVKHDQPAAEASA